MTDDADTARLAALCTATERAATEALGWFRQYPKRISAQRGVLEKEFRLAAVEARKLAAAARRPLAVGVYGLSQAGKSYLISTLARPPGKELFADLDRPRGFLAEINPESEKEATGLVTRFTMRREKGPDGFPARLRLLTEIDLVKILANSWYRDAKDPEAAGAVAPGEAAEALSRAEADAASGPEHGEVVAEDVWDLQDYFESEFRSYVTAQDFRGVFWDRMAAVLPRLPLARRLELYALLWNRFPPFTALIERLAGRLAALRFDRDAFAPIAALVPKTESVLSVDTLDHLHDPAQPEIEIVAMNGARTRLTRPELTALIAELQITMMELPWPILERTDLLDFPGARERAGKNHGDEIPADPKQLGFYFLRGKVAYLFERYAAERELNALLLCIKESNNPYDATIRQSIRQWIERTHGEKAADRARVETSLFILLTRMDMHFNRTPGRDEAASSNDLWEARIKASLQQPLQEANGWLDAWHPGRPFDNILLARNPGKSQSLSNIDANGVELNYLPGVEEKIARWGVEFAAHPDVRRYMRDPARAWAEVFRLNDAGMSYLVERLAPVCNPRLKLDQVAGQIATRRANMRRRLSEWHVGDDLEAEFAKRMAAIEPVIDQLIGCADAGRFAALLSHLHLTPTEAREVMLRNGSASAAPAASGSAPAAPAPARAGAARALFERTRQGAAAAAAAAPAAAPARMRDGAAERAEAIVEAWIGKVRRFSAEASLRGRFGLDAAHADALSIELVAAAGRLGLAERIAAGLRAGGRTERFDLAAERHALASAMLVSEHVNFCGCRIDGALIEDRPKLGGSGAPVFTPPPPPGPDFEIDDEPEPAAALFAVGWTDALAHAVRRNVYDSKGAGTVDEDENRALGTIIKALA
ncbi:virulence factor SrfC family protein [Elioraea sp.]|uniref:virulence factor SrfC family protein n=1 Tax=Elioraea sp. TaxID=2185103 RepID=UPI003F6F49B1